MMKMKCFIQKINLTIMSPKLLITLMMLVTTAVTMSAQDVQEQTPAPVIHIQSTPGEHRFIVNENHYNVYITDDVVVYIEPADEAEGNVETTTDDSSSSNPQPSDQGGQGQVNNTG